MRTPTIEVCTGCTYETRHIYWYHYEWRVWLPFCETCAIWIAEGFTPAAAIAEACEIIQAARQVAL